MGLPAGDAHNLLEGGALCSLQHSQHFGSLAVRVYDNLGGMRSRRIDRLTSTFFVSSARGPAGCQATV